MNGDIILIIVVCTAVVFDFTNGFHDTANVVATTISTRAIAPRPAVAIAALLNFVGAFISLQVAETVGKGFVDTGAVTTTVVFAGLIGGISWNLITWYYGLPSSSSHALIGGLVGAVIAAQGAQAVTWGGLVSKLIVPAIVAPVVAFLVAVVLPVLPASERATELPTAATIEGATKLTGQLGGGASFGALSALTGRDAIRDSGADLGIFTCDRPLQAFYERAGWQVLPGSVLVGGTPDA